MKIKLNFGSGVISLPLDATVHLGRAQKEDIAVLLELASKREYCDGFDGYADEIAANVGISRSRLDEAVAFWRGTGIIDISSPPAKKAAPKEISLPAETKAKSEKATATVSEAAQADDAEQAAESTVGGKQAGTSVGGKRIIEREKALPTYTTEELARVLEGREDTRLVITEAERVVGKIFNTSEANVIVGLTDYLGLDGEYILLLIAHCVDAGKKSLRYIERTAIGLFDNGIDTTEKLEEYFARVALISGFEGEIRRMFGMGARDFTAKEKEYLENWVCVFRADAELIRAAYEVTVNATGKASFSYANKVLERWHGEGIHSLGELERAKDKESVRTSFGNSFDTDEFFAAARRHGFEGS